MYQPCVKIARMLKNNQVIIAVELTAICLFHWFTKKFNGDNVTICRSFDLVLFRIVCDERATFGSNRNNVLMVGRGNMRILHFAHWCNKLYVFNIQRKSFKFECSFTLTKLPE